MTNRVWLPWAGKGMKAECPAMMWKDLTRSVGLWRVLDDRVFILGHT